ncbi:otoancorin [Pimephales promelas]|nr:otoancorin [Pimephales promelas]
MVTEAQRAGLRVDQRSALDEAVGLKTARAEVASPSPSGLNPVSPLPLKGGAAAESMTGCVLMQAIVLMLLRYIL